jgi:hypothetical protein
MFRCCGQMRLLKEGFREVKRQYRDLKVPSLHVM